MSQDAQQQATAIDRTDHVVGILLADPDAVRRYATVQALQSGRLREVQAISLRQLEIEHGSVAAAAAAVSVSRQSAGELLDKADIPAADSPLIRDTPAYAYGRYLAVVWAIAASHPDGHRRSKMIDDWGDLSDEATRSVALLPKVTETAMRWLKGLRHARNRATADARARELDEAGAAIASWVESRRAKHLTVEEQFAVVVGISSTRTEYRRRWERTGSA